MLPGLLAGTHLLAGEHCRTLAVKRFDAFLEVLGAAQAAVAVTFHFDRDGQRRIFVVVDQFFRRALSQRREAPQFISQRIDVFSSSVSGTTSVAIPQA